MRASSRDRPDLIVGVGHGDPVCLDDEAGDSQEEERSEEHPVPDDVGGGRRHRARRRAGVVVARGSSEALGGHHDQADDQGEAEQIGEQRVPEVEAVAPELEVEERLQDVVVEHEDAGGEDEDEEAVREQEVAEAGQLVRGRWCGGPGLPVRRHSSPAVVEPGLAPPLAVLAGETPRAVEEDAEHDRDEGVEKTTSQAASVSKVSRLTASSAAPRPPRGHPRRRRGGRHRRSGPARRCSPR